MTAALVVTHVAFANASTSDQQRGLLGYVRVEVNDVLVLDGITLRRTMGGRRTLSYPARRDVRGQTFPYVRLLADARVEFERQVFEALDFNREAMAS